jgi:hypothetical protein
MKILKMIFLFIFSVGWLVPLYFSFSFLFDWFHLEVAPVIYQKIPTFSSFPMLYYSKYLFFIAFFWMCIVIIFWIFSFLILYKKLTKKISEIESSK